LLIGAIFFAGIQLGKGNTQGTANNTPSTTNQSGSIPTNSSTTSINGASTSVPTATPSPPPTQTSPVGKVLYETHNFSGWTGTSDWKVLSDTTHTLVNDATRDHSQPPYGPSIPAPYLVQGTDDYAVEAMIQVSSTNVHTYYPCFGITVRGTPVGTSWQGYYIGIGCYTYLDDAFMSDVNTIDSYLKSAQFTAGTSWHTYRVEVRGNDIKFLIDGGLILELTDNTYLTGSQVGLFCYSVQLSVSYFKVIGL